MPEQRESVLTDLTRQVGDLRMQPLDDVTLNGQGWAFAANGNPIRLAMYAMADDASAVAFVPREPGLPVSIARLQSLGAPAVVHAAVYPVLVLDPWWVVGTPGTVVHLWEVSKER